jgi:trk system potassium uptake protein
MLRVFSNKHDKYEQVALLPQRRWTNPSRIVFISFIVAILAGSALLTLPISAPEGKPRVKYVDALFTSASATCVTGLIVKDTSKDFSLFGQIVIIVLIQAGGLGIMTMATFFLLLFGRKVSFRDTASVDNSLGRSGFSNFRHFMFYVLLVTFTIEALGTLILFSKIVNSPVNDYPFGKSLYVSAFHSISAFCNAGFSLYSDNLVRFNDDPVVVLTVAFLIIIGGIGFLVIYNFLNLRFWKKDRIERGRLSLHTKVVLFGTGILLAVGFFAFLIFEWNGTMKGMPFWQKSLNSFFCSVTPRTAGYNTIDYSQMSKPGILTTMFLMFIGASPASTGGGIKTATFVVLIVTSWSMIKGTNSVSIFRRSIPARIIQETVGVILLSTMVVMIMSVALSITEQYSDFGYGPDDMGSIPKIVFEVISAFGTVGLSTGITPFLSDLGKILLTLTMFIGRIGPLVAALAIGQREIPPEVTYPEERIMVG